MKNEYSISDCLKLKEILDRSEPLTISLLFYDEVIAKAKEVTCTRMVTSDDLFNYIIEFFKLVNTKKGLKLIDFVFYKKFEEVPLYINDPELITYVKWRLEIAK